jgi:chromo domain-containing protein 1
MDLDSPVQSEAQEQPYPKPRPDGPSRSVERKIKFGSAKDSEPVNAILDGIPSTSDDPWLCGFLDTEVLQMDYTCFAKDFASQKQQVYQYLLCSGTVSSTSSGSVLDNVAVHLRDGILGLYYSTKSFNLILYPSSSDEWRSILSEQGVSSTYGSGSALRYIIFRSPVDFGPFLRRPGKEKLERNPASFDDQLLSRLFKFNYKALLPPKTGMDTNPPYHCFLLFPRTRGDQVAMIARWIRSCNSRCQIFTSYDSGAWSSFCDAVGKGAGIVIVHELLALSLHRIPDLWQRLHNFFEGYWCFSEAIQPQPVFPSLTLPDDVVPMGDMQFTELFPTWPRRRIVVLLTPSFLTSEPLRVFQLLEWFYTFIACRSSQKCKLLTAYTLHEYLGDLALQKSRERDEILEKSRHSISQAEITANIKGLSRDDCENRFKAWSLALELHQMRAGAAGPDDVDEDICSIIYADPSIDANDEQSLVNWFGWWTSMRLDQFRGFHVIGSSSSMKFNGSKKGERFIRIPKYSEGTVNVPDLVREEVERQNNPVAPPAAPSETTIIPSRPAVHRNNSSAGPGGSSQPWVFQSRFVTAESERGFTDAMGKAFYSAGQGKGYLTTFKYPISWTDSHMSFYFSDVQEKFRTVKNWWSFPHAFWYNNRFSTYMGFFYTIAEDWDPENPPADRRPKRHPWICVYRPSSPYVRRGGSAGPCQLIIWDPAAKHKFAGSTTTGEEELTWVQRHVVQLVRDQTPMKNTGSWLDQVWLGGFKHPEADSPYLIDIALQYFKNLQKSLYSELPADEAHLRMLKFRKLRLKAPPPAQNDGQSSTMSEPMDLDTPGGSSAGDPAEKIDNTVMIFHPPRGKPLPSGRTTQCINHLYEAASAAMDEGRAIGGRMRYEFPVTSEWYEAQRFEGRGYEHVNVAPWESVFNLLKIQSSVPQQGAPTARTPQRTSSSAASVERTVNG